MFYRWPQGRIVRTVSLVLCALVAVDLAYTGAYAQFDAWSENASLMSLSYALLFAAVAVAVAGGGLAAVGFVPRSAQFLIEVEEEMAKVVWPSRADLIRFTILIALMAIVLAVLILLVDLGNYWLLKGIRSWGGG